MSAVSDLHIHTHFSDSTASPEEVVEEAHQKGLCCIGITDHDTVDGIQPTMEAARKYGLEVIPGIELSSEIQGRDIHVLGYMIDFKNSELLKELNAMQNFRVQRMEKMIDKLKNLGIERIELDEVCALSQSKAVGRPHLAKVLVDKGCVPDFKAAFDRYLAEGQPAYVSKTKQLPEEVIALINGYGGVAVLAHPMMTRVDELIPGFVKAGLKGLEVFYANTSQPVRDFYEGIARKHGLIMTGGSDAHGEAKKNTFIGKCTVPYTVVEQLKQAST